MHLKKVWLVAGLAVLLSTPGAGADAPEIYPLSKVKRGDTGYGMTTMSGTTPTRFEFEVIGVNKNFLPKMDIILVKSDDPQLEVSGFWQGMSGSPLYINDTLTCAFSYGFRFNKKAIGGCTPLHYMKKEGFDTPLRSNTQGSGATPRNKSSASNSSGRTQVEQPAATLDEWLRVAPNRDVDSALAKLGAPRTPWLMSTTLPAVTKASEDDEEAGMVAASVPLAMSGFSKDAFDVASNILDDYPIAPMRAGGTGDPSDGPTEFVMGGAIGVQLIRGDMSATATGTVSYIDGDRVLAFGHPMFQAGEIYAPVATAEIHTVIPSALSAFIVASPLREIGALVQDRQSTIMADTSLATRMIPVDIQLEMHAGGKTEKGEFHVEILNNKYFSGSLAGVAAMNAASYYMPDRDPATAYMESSVYIKGHKPIQFVDYLHSANGPSGIVGGARGLRVLVPLLMNPYSPLEIERVELNMVIKYDNNYGDIVDIRLPSTELPPGERTYVDVTMETYDGEDIVERIPFDVPATLAGSIVRVEVTAGDATTLDSAPPESLDDLVDAFRQLLPGNVYAVTLYTADEGVAIDGQLIKDLPASALDKLKTVSRTQKTSTYRPMARSIAPATRVINGGRSKLVKIADK
jgi:hypothetical protein